MNLLTDKQPQNDYDIIHNKELKPMENYESLNELAQEILKINRENGFNQDHEVGVYLMLIVSELGEAMEADRTDKYADVQSYEDHLNTDSLYNFQTTIKDTFEDEIADTFIRLLHFVALKGIDIEFFIRHKLEYNKKRSYRHGKKY